MQYNSDKEAVDALGQYNQKLDKEIHKIIVGQNKVVEDIILSIFSGGHTLLVGVPGLAKTLLVNTIAQALGLNFKRIQFTPDLMPSDIIGTEILDENRAFRFLKGPVFSNIILADEINRTPPKTQSALLEAMQEKAVTAAGKSYQLEAPFYVLATQNPIEQEGTYPLPEAQLDRFMFNINLDYPDYNDEVEIVKATTSEITNNVEKVIDRESIIFFQQLIRRVPVNDSVVKHAVWLTTQSRPGTPDAHKITDEYITWGAGPRASQYLILGAKAHAALHGKYSPDNEDVNAVAKPVFRHRLVKNFKAEAEQINLDDIIDELIKTKK
ncbi:AAA family ATPase [Salinivirga cyanobacteriivorans]|uniref:Magnesium chelatase ATPase subunit D n=1 Tax=Salinivirga cyanobacteriivorans TaxID=1307839 RepID=A0A0S2I2Q0_9BACT|nr:AAA family ATPase [Salinivirga cyanobacteriivorans]ALO16469.1 magnesium chelatase ATPase subunit D [Salinivirga cyanobacteriivorans]